MQLVTKLGAEVAMNLCAQGEVREVKVPKLLSVHGQEEHVLFHWPLSVNHSVRHNITVIGVDCGLFEMDAPRTAQKFCVGTMLMAVASEPKAAWLS